MNVRSCDVENLGDFYRYYSGGWVGLHEENTDHVIPCTVHGQLDDNHMVLRQLIKDEKGTFTMSEGKGYNWTTLKDNLDFGAPEVGMMPEGPTVVFCSYATPRSPRKGYRPRELTVVGFNSWEIRKKYVEAPTRDRYESVWFAFNPEYLSLVQAEAKLAAGEAVGVPISRTLSIYSLPRFKNSLLAYKRWTIGRIDSPYLIKLLPEYRDYEEDIAQQTGAEVIVG